MSRFACRVAALSLMGALFLPAGASATPPPARQDVALQGSAALASAGSDRVYRSCRRQVRRAAGIIPGMRMRLPRAYIHLVDRCVGNGGVYS